MKKFLVAALVAVGLAACGSTQVAYAPATWGPAGYCYYLYSPYECYGHHPGSPVLMPLWWHLRYADYYDSPAYNDVYVPRRYRSVAVSRAKTFDRTYSSRINAATKAAVWKGSNGKTVSGAKVSKSSLFGSGGGYRSTGGSSGSLRSSPPSSACGQAYHLVPAAIEFTGFSSSGGRSSGGFSSSGRSSGSSSSGRSSFGGGSARSGSGVGSSGKRSRGGSNC